MDTFFILSLLLSSSSLSLSLNPFRSVMDRVLLLVYISDKCFVKISSSTSKKLQRYLSSHPPIQKCIHLQDDSKPYKCYMIFYYFQRMHYEYFSRMCYEYFKEFIISLNAWINRRCSRFTFKIQKYISRTDFKICLYISSINLYLSFFIYLCIYV